MMLLLLSLLLGVCEGPEWGRRRLWVGGLVRTYESGGAGKGKNVGRETHIKESGMPHTFGPAGELLLRCAGMKWRWVASWRGALRGQAVAYSLQSQKGLSGSSPEE
jgi:hypothetical protein